MNKCIYLDNAATTPTDERVVKSMMPYFGKHYANAGALHDEGVIARKALDVAREKVARVLQARKEEIIFTSGGTESDNLAIRGVVNAARNTGKKSPHIVTIEFEHSAVIETCKALEKEGVKVTYIKPEKNGIVRAENIKKALKKNTVLVSVMYVQNEIGTIQPIKEISRKIKEARDKRQGNLKSVQGFPFSSFCFPLLHVDACQAPNYLDVCPNHIGADLMTLTGSKIYGPKGSGILYVRHGVPISPILYGGEQEAGIRPGTEPVYLAVGFAEALGLAAEKRNGESERLTKLQVYFIDKLLALDNRVHLNGDRKYRVPHIVNVSIDGIDNEFFVIQLSAAGIACATRSACKTNDDRGSHVIMSIGKSEMEAKESIRFSMGRTTTKKEIDYTLKTINNLLKAKS